jgi:hypothetical protein
MNEEFKIQFELIGLKAWIIFDHVSKFQKI